MASWRFGVVLVALLVLSFASPPDVPLSAQERSRPWIVSVQLAGLGSRAENDRWYVTEEGYHVHPFSDGFTPGIRFGLAYQAASNFRAGIDLLYGRAPVTLGMIDQNSSREPETDGSMGFGGILFTPSLTFPGERNWALVAGPVLGFGWMQEVRVDPPFGPSVTFGGGTQFILGGTVGLDIRLGESPFSFNGRLLRLNMDLPLAEDGMDQEMSKFFGPMGILAGCSYRTGW